nr:hypothetical protein [Tanacetum cinerariifolium]
SNCVVAMEELEHFTHHHVGIW